MEFISKYNLTFINFVNRKYNKRFKSFDEYGLWLYEEKECSNSRYYDDLEEDFNLFKKSNLSDYIKTFESPSAICNYIRFLYTNAI